MKLYTVPEVRVILKVRKGYVYEMVRDGRLRAVQLGERGLRVTEDALKEFLAEHEYQRK